jgi:hypothetical protein
MNPYVLALYVRDAGVEPFGLEPVGLPRNGFVVDLEGLCSRLGDAELGLG